MPVLSTVAAACARAWGFTAGDLFAGAALALDFDKTTTLDSRITFTRATNGTYFDSSGVLQTASSGVARFDHRLQSGVWVNKGLLIEEQRTNLHIYSEEMDNAAWTKTRTTVTADDTTSPDGTTNADAVFETADTGGHNVATTTNISTGASTTYSFSVFVKSNGRSIISLQMLSTGGNNIAQFDLSAVTATTGSVSGTGVVDGATIEDVGDGWYRCTIIGRTGQTLTKYYAYLQDSSGNLSYTGDVTKGVYLWGTQVEAGAFPTSYIKTTTASVTRNADQASMTSTNFSDWYNATEGTVFGQFDMLSDFDNSGYGPARAWAISDNTNDERYQLSLTNTPSMTAAVFDGGVAQAQLSFTPSPVTSGTIYVNAFAYKVNDFASSLNGSSVETDTSGTLPTVDRLYFGAAALNGTTNFINGHIAKFYYWNTRKSNNFLTSITS